LASSVVLIEIFIKACFTAFYFDFKGKNHCQLLGNSVCIATNRQKTKKLRICRILP
jgi:hypothetical protein